MSEGPASLLLPEGLRDRLPPEAEAASRVTRALIDAMRSHGYARVAPPIAEFRETLSGRVGGGGGGGEASERELLRFTDPVSRRTLAIRPDITRQVGRIATSRMADAPRPLRLSYAGQVLKLRASELWPEREMLQAGAELIGSDSAAAAAEIVNVAVMALAAAGVTGITVDFTLPDCVETLAAAALPVAADQLDAVKAALDAKDAGALQTLGAAQYLPLIAAAGPFDAALVKLRAFDRSGVLTARLDALAAIAATLADRTTLADRATLTLDPTERHGFEYQSWFGFSLFVAGHSVTIGRGGSYCIVHPDGRQEAAIGFSLYPDPLIAAGLGTSHEAERRLFVPLTHDPDAAARLRSEGWATVAALDPNDDGRALGCTHRLAGTLPLPY